MIERQEWTAISARIAGLVEVANLYLSGRSSEDTHATVTKVILPEAVEIFDQVSSFSQRYRSEIPPAAAEALESFFAKHTEVFKADHSTHVFKGEVGVQALVPRLSALRSSVDYHLRDFEALARSMAERAFMHLQRSIVVDDELRAKWKQAFDKGEVACEKLGAVHLLLHGIWGFKVSAKGEETDLVFGDAMVPRIEDVRRTSEALVATEWKRLTNGADANETARIARKQLGLYSSGSLGGLELRRYQFVVLVSEHPLAPMADVSEGSVCYRHVNIAVAPGTPSKEAKSR